MIEGDDDKELSKAAGWTLMSQTKGDSALRQKDYSVALTHFTRAIALALPGDRDVMVALLCRRAVALLYLKVSKRAAGCYFLFFFFFFLFFFCPFFCGRCGLTSGL
jgi:hypothetical protein